MEVKIGDIFGKWVILDKKERVKGERLKYICKCSCNKHTIREVLFESLREGKSKLCRCSTGDYKQNNENYHCMSHTRFYNIYVCVKTRCLNKNSQSYKNYGERGIKICKEWEEDFTNFYKDMYKSYIAFEEENGKDTATIERIDVNGNYTLDNCKWITLVEQGYNKTNSLNIEYRGEIKCFREWANHFNINTNLAYMRYKYLKWSFEESFGIINKKENKMRGIKTLLNDTYEINISMKGRYTYICSANHEHVAILLRDYCYGLKSKNFNKDCIIKKVRPIANFIKKNKIKEVQNLEEIIQLIK